VKPISEIPKWGGLDEDDIPHMNISEVSDYISDSTDTPSLIRKAASRLRELHDLTRWIPVSEGLPTEEDGGECMRVLIRYNDGDMDSIFVNDVSQFTTGSEFWITHWKRITPPETP
jgi:hypothetical protein